MKIWLCLYAGESRKHSCVWGWRRAQSGKHVFLDPTRISPTNMYPQMACKSCSRDGEQESIDTLSVLESSKEQEQVPQTDVVIQQMA